MIRLMLAILVILIAPVQQSASYYVAPYGTNAGDGSADSPRTLAWAMASAPSGSTVWLIPGTYAGDKTITAPGVTYRSEVGTRARLDGGLTIAAAGVAVRDLEITDTSWLTRTVATTAQQARAVTVTAQHVTLDGNYIHDLAGGIYAFNGSGGASAGLVATHNLIYNIGWAGHGHAFYIQNDNTGAKLIQANVLLNQYGFGMHAYGSSGPSAQLQHITFDGNVQVNNRALIGGGNTLRDIKITHNRLWNSVLEVGYTSIVNEDVAITGNWIGLERMQVRAVMTPTVTLNRFAHTGADVTLVLPKGAGAWDNNSYWRANGGAPFDIDGQGSKTLAQWRAYTGWDATSVYTGSMPLSNWIDVQSWGAQRGAIVIYNWTQSPTVTLDLSALALTPGASYKLINAQQPAQFQTFTAGSPVPVPMTGWGTTTPYGSNTPSTAWDSRFAVFLIEPR